MLSFSSALLAAFAACVCLMQRKFLMCLYAEQIDQICQTDLPWHALLCLKVACGQVLP